MDRVSEKVLPLCPFYISYLPFVLLVPILYKRHLYRELIGKNHRKKPRILPFVRCLGQSETTYAPILVRVRILLLVTVFHNWVALRATQKYHSSKSYNFGQCWEAKAHDSKITNNY